jgi:membrane protein DedA with SNARE-associated domain
MPSGTSTYGVDLGMAHWVMLEWFGALWLFVESLGVPLLSEGAFASFVAAVQAGRLTLWESYLIAYLATIGGNAAGYWAFALWGPRIQAWLSRRWPSIPEQMSRVEPRIRKSVWVAMGIARFVGLGTFGIVLWVAGLVRVPARTFLPYLFALDLIWTAIWLFASNAVITFLLDELRSLEHLPIPILVGTGVAAVVGALVLHRGVKKWLAWRRKAGQTQE